MCGILQFVLRDIDVVERGVAFLAHQLYICSPICLGVQSCCVIDATDQWSLSVEWSHAVNTPDYVLLTAINPTSLLLLYCMLC